MNELLVCLASAPFSLTEEEADIAWHEDAEFWPRLSRRSGRLSSKHQLRGSPVRADAVNFSSISFGINPSMVRYRIQLLDAEGMLASEHVGIFSNDHMAIDHAGWIDHPHALRVWRSAQLVADLPQVPRHRSATLHDGRLSGSELRLLRSAMAALEREFDFGELARPRP